MRISSAVVEIKKVKKLDILSSKQLVKQCSVGATVPTSEF